MPIIAAVGAGLLLAGKHAADVAFEAQNIATLTGDSVEEASRLNAVWKQSGADSKDLQDVLLQMNGVLADNADIAATLGINLNDGATIGQRFEQVAQALDRIPDAAERSRIASQVFGEEGVRQYNNMRNAVGDLSDALANVPEGSVIDEDDVEKAREMQQQMREVTAEFQAFATSIGTVVLPAIGALFEGFNDLFAGAEDVGRSIRGWFDGGEAQRNREFANSIEVVDAAYRQFDQTLLDGAKTAADVRVAGEKWADTLEDGADKTYAANLVVAEWSKANREAEEATRQHARALRENAREATYNADANDEMGRIQRATTQAVDAARAAQEAFMESIRHSRDEVGALKREIDDEQAWLNLQGSMEATIAKLNDGETSARDQRLAILDLKEQVLEYAESINLPDRVVTQLLAQIDAGQVANVEALLARWGNGITLPIRPQVISTGGGSRIRVDEHGNVRHYDTGGVVPGPRGSEQLAVVHGGETILPTHRPNATMPAGVSVGAPNVNVSVTLDGRELKALVRTELDEWERGLVQQLRQGVRG